MILAIVGFAGVLLFARGGGVGGGGTTPVVVAAHDIDLRAQLSAADLRIDNYSTANVPPGAYTSTRSLIGQIAAVNLVTGQPILQNLVSSSAATVVNSATSYLPIPHGFVAVTIPSAEQQAVGGYVQSGDYISIIAIVTPKNQPYPVARTVYTNVHVIRVGPASTSTAPAAQGTLASGTAAGVSSSITVVVNECDAEFLSWFISETQLKYTLESYQDYQSQTTQVDATCPAVTAAKGVTGADVARRWPGLLTA